MASISASTFAAAPPPGSALNGGTPLYVICWNAVRCTNSTGSTGKPTFANCTRLCSATRCRSTGVLVSTTRTSISRPTRSAAWLTTSADLRASLTSYALGWAGISTRSLFPQAYNIAWFAEPSRSISTRPAHRCASRSVGSSVSASDGMHHISGSPVFRIAASSVPLGSQSMHATRYSEAGASRRAIAVAITNASVVLPHPPFVDAKEIIGTRLSAISVLRNCGYPDILLFARPSQRWTQLERLGYGAEMNRHSRVPCRPIPPTPPGRHPPKVEWPALNPGPARACQYPMWDHRSRPTQLFCGRPSHRGTSYCAEHRARCFVPVRGHAIQDQARAA